MASDASSHTPVADSGSRGIRSENAGRRTWRRRAVPGPGRRPSPSNRINLAEAAARPTPGRGAHPVLVLGEHARRELGLIVSSRARADGQCVPTTAGRWTRRAASGMWVVISGRGAPARGRRREHAGDRRRRRPDPATRRGSRRRPSTHAWPRTYHRPAPEGRSSSVTAPPSASDGCDPALADTQPLDERGVRGAGASDISSADVRPADLAVEQGLVAVETGDASTMTTNSVVVGPPLGTIGLWWPGRRRRTPRTGLRLEERDADPRCHEPDRKVGTVDATLARSGAAVGRCRPAGGTTARSRRHEEPGGAAQPAAGEDAHRMTRHRSPSALSAARGAARCDESSGTAAPAARALRTGRRKPHRTVRAFGTRPQSCGRGRSGATRGPAVTAIASAGAAFCPRCGEARPLAPASARDVASTSPSSSCHPARRWPPPPAAAPSRPPRPPRRLSATSPAPWCTRRPLLPTAGRARVGRPRRCPCRHHRAREPARRGGADRRRPSRLTGRLGVVRVAVLAFLAVSVAIVVMQRRPGARRLGSGLSDGTSVDGTVRHLRRGRRPAGRPTSCGSSSTGDRTTALRRRRGRAVRRLRPADCRFRDDRWPHPSPAGSPGGVDIRRHGRGHGPGARRRSGTRADGHEARSRPRRQLRWSPTCRPRA
jgi:hypothetical protein